MYRFSFTAVSLKNRERKWKSKQMNLKSIRQSLKNNKGKTGLTQQHRMCLVLANSFFYMSLPSDLEEVSEWEGERTKEHRSR